MWTNVLSPEGRFDKLKRCTINSKTIPKVIHQRVISNKSTKEIKKNHKKIANLKEGRKKRKGGLKNICNK